MKDRIRQLMELKKMTQKEFAADLCVAEGTLSSIFTGRTRPTSNIVSAIHECFPEVSIYWLMFGEGQMMQDTSGKSETQDAIPSSYAAQPAIPDLFSSPTFQPQSVPQVHEQIKYIDKPQRKITEIRVFYDDGTFETFMA